MQRLFGRLTEPVAAPSLVADAPARAGADTEPAVDAGPARAREGPGIPAWLPPPQRIFQERPQQLVVPGLCASFILIGLALMLNGWERIENARTSARWPTVRGVIVGAEVYPLHTSEGRKWRPVITYQYLARGRELTGTRLSLQEPASGYDERTARRIASRYRLQTPVTVYYNPERFTEAVLEQSVPRSAYYSLAIGALLALPGSGLVLVIGMTIGRRRLGALRRRYCAPMRIPAISQPGETQILGPTGAVRWPPKSACSNADAGKPDSTLNERMPAAAPESRPVDWVTAAASPEQSSVLNSRTRPAGAAGTAGAGAAAGGGAGGGTPSQAPPLALVGRLQSSEQSNEALMSSSASIVLPVDCPRHTQQ